MFRLVERIYPDDEGPFPAPGSWIAKEYLRKNPMAIEVVWLPRHDLGRYTYDVCLRFPLVLPIRVG